MKHGLLASINTGVIAVYVGTHCVAHQGNARSVGLRIMAIIGKLLALYGYRLRAIGEVQEALVIHDGTIEQQRAVIRLYRVMC